MHPNFLGGLFKKHVGLHSRTDWVGLVGAWGLAFLSKFPCETDASVPGFNNIK